MNPSKSRSINRQIFVLAIPNILSNLTEPMLAWADTIFIGHLGAMALAGTVLSFLFWTFAFLRMGTTGITAQAYGEDNKQKQIITLSRALGLGLFFGLMFIVLQKPISWLWLSTANASPEVEHYAQQYFTIRIYSAPAALMLFALNGWFLGMQNARVPLLIVVVENLLNIFLNYIFIYQMGMKIEGAALGTVIAEYVGVALALYFFFKYYHHLLASLSFKSALNFQEIFSFFQINANLFLRTLFLVVTFNFFTLQGAQHGDIILAANNILLLLWMTYAFGIDGIGLAAESICGKYIGRKDRDNLIKSIKLLFFWGFIFAGLYTLIYGVFGKQLLAVFTNQQIVIDTATRYLGWTVLATLINCAAFIWDGIYTGATSTKALRDSMGICAMIVFLPLWFVTTQIFMLGNDGLWLSMVLFMFARGLALTVLSPKYILAKI